MADISVSFAIDSVQLPCLDSRRDAVSDFYGRLVGLRALAAADERLRFALGEAMLWLAPVREMARLVKPDCLTIKTDAFETMRARLESAGYDPVCSLPQARRRVMYVKDPSGNQLAFLGHADGGQA